MTVQLKGRPEVITIQWIPKYTFMERLGHWLHTATFVPLAITGMILYFPFLQPLAQGEAGLFIRLVHRVAAVIFGLLPIVYYLVEPRRLILHLREFLLRKEDIGWLKAAPAYYLLGKHEAMPPQGRFNAGEKLNGLMMIVTWFVFGITGIPMWFGKGVIPPEIFRWLVVFHDLAMIVSVCMLMVHLYLAVAHPLMWAGLVSMRFGVTSAEYAAEHHAKWFYGPKRAMEMWEAKKREAAHH
ncbi:MAG: cytochrome b/b6 domain-containing protein [Anaerolineae bacterium]|nr:cytochrome b/b6 domain-containing protein [Anaerolineae bacterium]MCX8068030.1 cytochrome b/b6 domain-containing protein [Anaerolineae bacterium]MDW7992126.1 cytochrome b/b6 domain-containing protein [Anaerolineae bacterium]